VGTAWQVFTWLLAQCAVIVAFVKRISCGNSVTVAHVVACTMHSYWCTWQVDQSWENGLTCGTFNLWTVCCAPVQRHRHSTTTSERRHLPFRLMMMTMTPEPAQRVPGVDPARKI
jgi:hypothetical protein